MRRSRVITPRAGAMSLGLYLLATLAAGCSADGGDGGPRVVFPRDHAPHSEQMEWWYYTGRLTSDDADKETYGFELTVFQPRILGKYIYISHFTVTDLREERFDLDMQISAKDQRDAVPTGFELQAGKATIEGHEGRHVIRGEMETHTLELTLDSETPPILQYGSGWMTVGSSEPFYYYSYPRMVASGSLTKAGKKIPVRGRVWMDHQWGTIGDGFGWDWFSLRLDDGSDLMVFKVRKDGGQTGFFGGTLIKKDGSTVALEDGDIAIENLGQWKSPDTDITYSHGWTIDVPKLGLSAEITPLLANQEFRLSLGSPIYWEGLCDVKGTRQNAKLSGHAYVEITGYVPPL